MQRSTLAKIGLTAVVVLGGGGFLVKSSIGHAQHYMMVHELVDSGIDKWKDKELKVHGIVEGKTIVEDTVDQETRRTFVLEKEGKKIRVFSAGPKPDTFKDQSEVVATGRLVPAASMQKIADELCARPGSDKNPKPSCPIKADAEQPLVVDATELMAKCPSKYKDGPSVKIDTNFKASDK
jgi:cytochrome c-type biogenesis protein CcmE